MDTAASTILAEVKVAFADAGVLRPPLSLRAGDALDDYDKEPPPFDAVLDSPTDAYLERNFWGIGYLDPASFHHYVPRLVEYTLDHLGAGSAVGEFLISALCPPDLEPPRLSSFSPEQERALTRFLDFLAFTDESSHQESAQRALEEWWGPGALYRLQNAV
jgi:hypothetical protein